MQISASSFSVRLAQSCLVASVFLALGATACATFSREECQRMNWADQGFESATRGESASTGYGYYQRECGAEHDVTPDLVQFNQGFETGLKQFCTASNGLEFGREGKRYNETCPQNLEKAFLEKYQLGRIEYSSDQIASLQSQVYDLQRQNQEKDAEISHLQSQLSSQQH